jgi:hypothetical protein
MFGKQTVPFGMNTPSYHWQSSAVDLCGTPNGAMRPSYRFFYHYSDVGEQRLVGEGCWQTGEANDSLNGERVWTTTI